MSCLRFVLLTIGLVYFISMSAIFSTARQLLARVAILRALLYCSSCCGFWIGVTLYFAGFFPHIWNGPLGSWVQDAAVAGFIAMAIANVWHHWLFAGASDAWALEQANRYAEEPSNAAQTKEETDVRG